MATVKVKLDGPGGAGAELNACNLCALSGARKVPANAGKAMTQSAKTDKGSRAAKRRARLAAELRSNLRKRKDQARSRAESEDLADKLQGRDEAGRS